MHLLNLPLFLTLIGSLFLTSIEAQPPATNKIRVALFKDQGARPRDHLIAALETAPDIALTLLDGEELRQGELKNFDLLLVPGGSALREAMSMKPEGRNEVRRFVSNGGLYMGICAGCYMMGESKPAYLGLMPLETMDKAHWQRGKGYLPVEITPIGDEIFGTNQREMQILYHNGPVIDTSHMPPGTYFVPLAYYRGELVGRGGRPGVMINSVAMYLGRFGKGLVIGISPHPEATPSQVSMELNAIRWLYNHRG